MINGENLLFSQEKFIITDDIIQNFTQQDFVSFNKNFHLQIFHKYFLSSIGVVQQCTSKQFLVDKLGEELETGIYHLSLSVVDDLFQILFEILPDSENFITNETFRLKLIRTQNLYIYRFYNFSFSFIYRPTYPNSIFQRPPHFAVLYFNEFSKLYKKMLNESDIQTLNKDGSMLAILNYLYTILLSGEFTEIVSDTLSNLFKMIDLFVVIEFLNASNYFQSGSSIITANEFSIRASFLIPFYSRMFSNLIKTKPDEFLSELGKFKFIEYINSYLESYLNQFQSKDEHFYPQIPNNNDLLDILSIFTTNFIDFDSIFLEFIEIIAKIISISDGFYENQIEWINDLLNFLIKHEKLDEFELLKQSIIDGIKNRIQFHGYFESIQSKHLFIMNPYFYFEFIFTSTPLFTPTELFERISIHEFEQIKILFKLVINYIHMKKIDNFGIVLRTIQYYHVLLAEKSLFDSFIELFVCMKYNTDQIFELSESNLLDVIVHPLFENNEMNFPISSEILFEFCELYCKYIISKPYLNDILTVGSTSNDIIIIKSAWIILQKASKPQFNEFVKRIVNHITELEPNEELIMIFAPYLIDFDFSNHYQIFERILSWIELIKPLSIPNEDIQPLEFNNKIIQTHFYLINCISKSFGFTACDAYIEFFTMILDKYGMCIETLNVLMILIRNLIPFINKQNFSIQMKQTNEMIYGITSTLIENITSTHIDNQSFNLKQDFYIHMFTFIDNEIDNCEEDLFDFSFCNFKHSCFYSYNMNGQKLDDNFHYLVDQNEENQFLDSREKNCMFREIATDVSQAFIKNLAVYSILSMNKFGFSEIYPSSKLIIRLALMNGMLPSENLEMFLEVLYKQCFGINEDQIQFWIGELIDRAASLINLPKKRSVKLEMISDAILRAIEKKNENVNELKCIASFLTLINENSK